MQQIVQFITLNEEGITAINVMVMCCLLVYLIIESGVKKKTKYEFLGDLKGSLDGVFGETINRFLIFPIFMILHLVFTLSLILLCFTTNNMFLFSVNILIVLIIVLLNQIYKGCIAHKYEKLFLNDYTSFVTLFEILFAAYKKVTGEYPSLNKKLELVHNFYTVVFGVLFSKLIYLIIQSIKCFMR